MCGIVGYVGPRNATPVIYDGLKRLEYRGYDSAGIAVIQNDRVEVRRDAGKLDALRDLLATSPIAGPIGIGHTRWATHGKANRLNAHPHLDCTGDLVVIHNGIVENFLDLRHELQAKGHVFKSETDTETIVHLVEEYTKEGQSFEEAARLTLSRLQGAQAVVLDESSCQPDRLIAARIGNAGGVTLGLGDGEMFLASDMPAILDYTRKLIFLESRQMAVIVKDGYKIITLDGELGRSARAQRALRSDRGGEGRISPLHAEGNLRASALDHGHDSRSRRFRSRSDRTAGDEPDAANGQCDQPHGDRRVWHVVARRARRALHDRVAGAHSRRGGHRLGVSLSQSRDRSVGGGADAHAERRNGRYAGRDGTGR